MLASPAAAPAAKGPTGSVVLAARLLQEARGVGQNVDRLARRLGCDRALVAKFARRLVDNGVWENGRTVCEWESEGIAHPAFWKDVAVAEGKLCRRRMEDGSLAWAAAGEWVRDYDPRRGSEWTVHPRHAAESAPGAPEEATEVAPPVREARPRASVRASGREPALTPDMELKRSLIQYFLQPPWTPADLHALGLTVETLEELGLSPRLLAEERN